MKNRKELAEYFNELGFKMGAEVGVFDGHYSLVLCQSIPNLKLYGIDPYTVYKGYRDHKFISSMERAENTARNRLKGFDYIFIKQFSDKAVQQFENGSLDFVYLDGNHRYEYIKQDIDLWTPKVRRGGIVSGHDYLITPSGNDGVIRAVNDYVNKNGYELRLTQWDLDNPVIDDRQISWYFKR